jgi:hypothetical protein
MMWNLSFWKQTAERAVKTAAQAALAFFVVGQTDLLSLDWRAVASGVGVAVVASVLTSLMSAPFGPEDSPSLVGE